METLTKRLVVLTLCNERPMSWNKFYSGMHWTKRKREVDRVHKLVRFASSGYDMFDCVVDISVIAYFKTRPLDSSNICGKVYEDGLKDIIIKDDSMKYVRRFTTESRIDKETPRVEIIISKV